MRCLLVWPPCASPSTIPGSLIAGAEVLVRRGCDVVLWDANLAFFLQALALDGESGASTLPAAAPRALRALRAGEFFRPEKYLRALGAGATELGLELPLPEEMAPARRALDRNELCSSAVSWFLIEHLPAWGRRAEADLVVLLVAHPTQENAAREACHGLGDCSGAPVHVVRNVEQIKNLIPAQGTTSGAPSVPARAIAGLPIGRYLSPDPIVSFHGTVGSEIPNHLVARLTSQLSPAGYVFGDGTSGCDAGSWLRTGPLSATGDVPASVSLPLDSDLSPESLETAHAFGLRVIRWQWKGLPRAGFQKTVAKASALGIWNHLTIPQDQASHPFAEFAARNPNIVHSVTSLRDDELLPFQRLSVQVAGRSGYEGLRPLPGEPFWKWLSDPSHLLLYAAKLGPRRVTCLRVEGSPPNVRLVGSDVTYQFLTPAALGSERLDEICRLVQSGGAVGRTWVRHNLERAYLIGVAVETGVVVGCSSLKHPREEYVERVREKCGLEIAGYLERGYTSVRPEYRGLGIGTRLLEGLTSRAAGRPIYSVVREDDRATQTIARRNQTRKVASFYSERADKEVGIWMPEQQLDGAKGAS